MGCTQSGPRSAGSAKPETVRLTNKFCDGPTTSETLVVEKSNHNNLTTTTPSRIPTTSVRRTPSNNFTKSPSNTARALVPPAPTNPVSASVPSLRVPRGLRVGSSTKVNGDGTSSSFQTSSTIPRTASSTSTQDLGKTNKTNQTDSSVHYLRSRESSTHGGRSGGLSSYSPAGHRPSWTATSSDDLASLSLNPTLSRNVSAQSISTEDGLPYNMSATLPESSFTDHFTEGEVLGKGITGEVRVVKRKRTPVTGGSNNNSVNGTSPPPATTATSPTTGKEEIETDRTYAMRTLNKGELDPRQLQELKTEIALLRRLDHPNVVRLVETFEDDKSIRLVMEHCTGGDLSTRVFRSERDVISTIFQITEAVAHCHFMGVVHRDLKLENIMFVSPATDSPVKIIDFGLSSTMNGPSLTENHAASKRLMETACGTAYYMAPEMLDRSYDEKVDVWAIGVIVYMILTGKAPFEGHSEKVVFRKIRKGIVDYSHEQWSRVSKEALSFVQSLLIVDPSKRCTAKQALNHEWLNRHGKTVIPNPVLGESVVMSFVNFGKTCRMRRAALLIVAHNANHDSLKDLSEFFKACDSQHSGSLSFSDFMGILHKFSKDKKLIDEDHARSIFTSLDLCQAAPRSTSTPPAISCGNNDSCECHSHQPSPVPMEEVRIRYSEFLAAVLELRLEVDQAALNEAFDRFDTQRQGFISKENLRELLGVAFSQQDVEEMMEEANIAGRVVTRQEFLALMIDGRSQAREKILGSIEEGDENASETSYSPHHHLEQQQQDDELVPPSTSPSTHIEEDEEEGFVVQSPTFTDRFVDTVPINHNTTDDDDDDLSSFEA